jgi:hypothetical protein
VPIDSRSVSFSRFLCKRVLLVENRLRRILGAALKMTESFVLGVEFTRNDDLGTTWLEYPNCESVGILGEERNLISRNHHCSTSAVLHRTLCHNCHPVDALRAAVIAVGSSLHLHEEKTANFGTHCVSLINSLLRRHISMIYCTQIAQKLPEIKTNKKERRIIDRGVTPGLLPFS